LESRLFLCTLPVFAATPKKAGLLAPAFPKAFQYLNGKQIKAAASATLFPAPAVLLDEFVHALEYVQGLFAIGERA
jgi:hypothetical protein